MNKFKLTAFLVFCLLISCQHSPSKKTKNFISDKKNQIEVIDFYSTHRCIACINIESAVKYTVETYFKKEVNKGTVVFKTINVDDKKNYEIVEKFEAIGTALFLNVIKDGKETHIDLTDFAFSKERDKEGFSKELKTKIENELKKL